MSLDALRDTVNLLAKVPVLWIPGLVCGFLAAVLWLLLNQTGPFFAGRLLIIFSLVALFFIIGMLSLIKKSNSTIRVMIAEGAGYFFKVLVPTLVIAFGILLVFVMVVLTLTLVGSKPDAGLLTFLVFGVVLPTVALTFFYDTAVIFEDKKVFDSLQRSIDVVTTNLLEVVLFFAGCLLILMSISFTLMVVWTAILADRLEPITLYNETQIQAFAPEQLTGMIGQDGIWITAIILFAWMTIVIPLLYTYKACFYRRIVGKIAPIQQLIGEYDGKGRWYKY
jgi:uncharacterized membrane protein